MRLASRVSGAPSLASSPGFARGAAKPRARWAEGGDEGDLEGFIAGDGEDEEAGPGGRKRVRARGPPRPRARKPAVVEETGGGEEDADADEEAPLSRRRGRKLR